MEYKVITVPASAMEAKVAPFLAEGWEPLGGPTYMGINDLLTQALIKKPPETEP